MIAAEQARAFLLLLLSGLVCALVHDAARFAGWVLGGRTVFTAFMDLLFGMLLAAVMTLAGVILGMNPMRLYMFTAVGLGAALWYGTIGKGARVAGLWIQRRWKTKKCKNVAPK